MLYFAFKEKNVYVAVLQLSEKLYLGSRRLIEENVRIQVAWQRRSRCMDG
jgi:hypothetical protein